MNDHQGDGVTRVWFALVLLCRVAASFNKLLKSDGKPMAFSVYFNFNVYVAMI
ncbi:hypothetical protein [Vibrio sp. 10N.222.54.A3]|uniref:hypothetical protein n=1 Tax=Vibrio sp. 10N.222.54.A3 TaxID=3229633 RepID=UPI00354E603B